ncbi:MAG: hypothetical protein RIB61_02580 [Roseicyclus sp.]|jgi:energy-coupling factor transporter ATP-binding protein EcfA2
MVNRIIEVMGPSGVGKTTLVKAFLEGEADHWITWPLPAADRKRQELDSDVHAHLFEAKIATILARPRVSVYQKSRLIQHAADILTIDQFCLEALPRPSILDEGLIQNVGSEVRKLEVTSATFSPRELLQNRAFVNLVGRPETILARVRDRQMKSDQEKVSYAKMTDDDIIQAVTKSLRWRQKLAGFLQEMGCPILMLETEISQSEKADALRKFVDGFRTPGDGPA